MNRLEQSDSFTQKVVLVTGATGFLGAHLIRQLVKKGAVVHAVSRRCQAAETGVTWWQSDLTNADEARRLIAQIQPEIVYHLSSMANGRRDVALVLPIFQAETVATVNLLAAVAETGIKRIVLPGSLEEPSQGMVPTLPYGAAKAASRMFGQMFHLLYKVPVVFLRIFMTYGPGQPDWKLIPYCIRSFLRGESPSVRSPDRGVDWIYVSDVVEALVRVGEVDDLVGSSIDVGSGKLVRVRGLIHELEEILCVKSHANYANDDGVAQEEVRCANVQVAKARLGWRPTVSLPDGLRLTVENIKSRI